MSRNISARWRASTAASAAPARRMMTASCTCALPFLRERDAPRQRQARQRRPCVGRGLFLSRRRLVRRLPLALKLHQYQLESVVARLLWKVLACLAPPGFSPLSLGFLRLPARLGE